jgi:hypothetical protein
VSDRPGPHRLAPPECECGLEPALVHQSGKAELSGASSKYEKAGFSHQDAPRSQNSTLRHGIT